MKINELKEKLKKCTDVFSIVSLSRSWFWAASELEYKTGEDLLLQKAKKLKPTWSVGKILVLRKGD